MRPSLVELLACISCRGPLDLAVTRGDAEDIEEGSLRCVPCGSTHPVAGGIPRFVPASLERGKLATAHVFGWQWNRYDELIPKHEQQFLDWIAPVRREDFASRVVLDGGCGKGRHLACAARFGALAAVGVDLSDAVEAAWRNVRHLPNAHVVQADLYNLPFREETFDLAYSIGVLHHLPDPRGGFDALVPLVRDGGRIAAWVYGRENNGWVVHLVSPVRERLTSRMPMRLLEALSTAVTASVLWPAAKLVYAPANRIAPGAASRILFYNDYLAYVAHMPFRELRTIVFDHLVAPTSFYLRRDEFAAWFTRDDLRDPQVAWHNRNSWRGTAIRAIRST